MQISPRVVILFPQVSNVVTNSIESHQKNHLRSLGNFQRVKYDIYDKYDIYVIWHLTRIYMSIWVSKEALGPQECSQHRRKILQKCVKGQKLKYPLS